MAGDNHANDCIAVSKIESSNKEYKDVVMYAIRNLRVKDINKS